MNLPAALMKRNGRMIWLRSSRRVRMCMASGSKTIVAATQVEVLMSAERNCVHGMTAGQNLR
jgi:hypothetical protein